MNNTLEYLARHPGTTLLCVGSVVTALFARTQGEAITGIAITFVFVFAVVLFNLFSVGVRDE